MFNCLARLILACTALAPVGASYAWVAWFEGYKTTAYFLAGLCLMLFLVCDWLLQQTREHLQDFRFNFTSLEPVDDQITASLLLYLLPLFTAKFDTLNWQVWLPTIALFIFTASAGYIFLFNPLLHIRGWHFYKVGTPEGVTYLLITKKHLRRAGTAVKTGQVTEYVLLDMEG